MKIYNKRSFTIIELIMTISVLGMTLVPLGGLSIEYMRSIVYSRDLGVVQGLAKLEMSKINNLAFNDPSLAEGTDTFSYNYEGYPYDLRRSVSFVSGFNNTLKEVRIRAYPLGKDYDQLIQIITYITDVDFGVGSGGNPVESIAANFLEVTGGSFYNSGGTHEFRDVTLTNTNSAGSITISHIDVTFVGTSGIDLQQVRIHASDGDNIRLTGPLASPTGQVVLAPNAVFNADASFNNSYLLNFNNQTITSISRLVFTMSDGSKTVEYFW